jgi:nuclear transcription Y subunit beta
MDSASENEELGATFLSETPHYLVTEDTEDSRDGEETDRSNVVLREQDRFLPIANVARLMKKSIPKTGKIAKDARECVQECVSEFVSFITSEASDRCHQEKRKTINGEDILFAMSSLGFDNYVDPLKQYLQKYREAMKGDKSLSMGEPYPISISNGEITEEMLQEGQAQGSQSTTTTDLEQEGVIFTYAPVSSDSLSANNEFTIV